MVTSWLKSSRLFLQQVRQEALRVIWPTQKDVVLTSIIVFIIAAIFAVYLFCVDRVVIAGLQAII